MLLYSKTTEFWGTKSQQGRSALDILVVAKLGFVNILGKKGLAMGKRCY